jgi:hypothetical protein
VIALQWHGVFSTFIAMGGGGCAIFGIEGVLEGVKGVNDGKGEDKGEVLIDWLLPAINNSKSVKLLDSNAIQNSSRRLGAWF